jgi:hypothetical protein
MALAPLAQESHSNSRSRKNSPFPMMSNLKQKSTEAIKKCYKKRIRRKQEK